MGLGERLLLNRAEAVARRAARQRRLDLERELAGYDSGSQRCDFEATLERYPDGVTHELREILSRQQMAREARAFPAIGRGPR
jgi:hypothetical protein